MKELKRQVKIRLLDELMLMLDRQINSKQDEIASLEDHIATLYTEKIKLMEG